MRRFITGIVLAATLVAIPALASADPQAPGTIQAYDFGFTNPATSDSTVTINAGETVSFSYPNGNNSHNVVFEAGEPDSCTPALPADPVRKRVAGDLPLQHPRDLLVRLRGS